MHGSRRRQVMKWFLIGVVAPLLLVTSYVSSYLFAAWLKGNNYLDLATHTRLEETIFLPLDTYALSDLPGGKVLAATQISCLSNGTIGFEEAYNFITARPDSDVNSQ